MELAFGLDHALRRVSLVRIALLVVLPEGEKLVHATRDIVILLAHVPGDPLFLGELALESVILVVDVVFKVGLLEDQLLLGAVRSEEGGVHDGSRPCVEGP